MSNEFRPDWASPPGATLQDILDERGLTQVAFAKKMKRPVKTINELIKGKCALTAETAIQLETALKRPLAEFWMQREAHYRLALARQKAKRK